MALIAALGGGVYAAMPGADGEIKACSRKPGVLGTGQGELRVIDPSKGSAPTVGSCYANEAPLSWNQKGPKGDKGEKGDQGIQGVRGQRATRAFRGQGRHRRSGGAGPQGDPGPAGTSGARFVAQGQASIPLFVDAFKEVLSTKVGAGSYAFTATVGVNGNGIECEARRTVDSWASHTRSSACHGPPVS